MSDHSAHRPRRALLIALLLAFLGFAIATQVGHDDIRRYRGMRGVELVELLKSTDAANDRLGLQIAELSAKRDHLRQSTRQSEAAAEEARHRAAQLAILAGSAGASGPGIKVQIDDPHHRISAALLLDAIEELRDAGAEAMVVNGTARVVAQTYFLDIPEGVSVGGHTQEPPYVVEAIGDPQTMAEAMRFRGGLVDRVEGRGASARVSRVDRVTITALGGRMCGA
jgi:uncharacterized protein YlxW (UPF0749 family)